MRFFYNNKKCQNDTLYETEIKSKNLHVLTTYP